MIEKTVVAASLVFLVFTIPVDCLAAVVVSVNNPGSIDDHVISVFPGNTFSIDINVSTSDEIFEVHGMSLVASAPDVLAVTGGSCRGPWTNSSLLPLGNLDPASSSFDVTLPNPMQYFGPGESTFATLDLQVNADAPTDLFSLNVVDAQYTLCWFCPAFGTVEPGPDFLVEVVPEPSSMLLLVGGALLLVGRRSVNRRPFA